MRHEVPHVGEWPSSRYSSTKEQDCPSTSHEAVQMDIMDSALMADESLCRRSVLVKQPPAHDKEEVKQVLYTLRQGRAGGLPTHLKSREIAQDR